LIVRVFLLGLVIAVVITALGTLWADELDFWGELAKAGIQLGVVVVGGAVLTTMISVLQAERENRRQESEALRLSILRDLTTAYDGLKEARRTLRASGLRSPSGELTAEQVDEFGAEMRSLNKLQLSLERCAKKIRTQSGMLANAGLLACHISRLEEYAHELIQEWEENSEEIVPGGDARSVANLQALQRFLAPAWTPDGFKENASAPMALLVREIEALRPTRR
jgi:hypothetical protein